MLNLNTLFGSSPQQWMGCSAKSTGSQHGVPGRADSESTGCGLNAPWG